MTNKLTEYKDYPTWVDTITPEEQHRWYLFAKKIVADTSRDNDNSTNRLVQAIAEYESKNNIK